MKVLGNVKYDIYQLIDSGFVPVFLTYDIYVTFHTFHQSIPFIAHLLTSLFSRVCIIGLLDSVPYYITPGLLQFLSVSVPFAGSILSLILLTQHVFLLDV